MSVLIKGMGMPYGCANCHFVSQPIYDAKGRARYVCNVPVEEVCGKGNTDEVIALYEGASEAFPDWCPLVEVPEPHGRLIDADKFNEFIEKNCTDNLSDLWKELVRRQPTVIEAEGE